MTELEIAQKAARIGGEVVAKYFREGVTFRSSKQSYNLVSDADVESERAIVEAIHSVFPNHDILAEEDHKGDPESIDLWVIDPLDGTNNFAHKIPYFSISVAYVRRGQPMCGVVYDPVTGDWFVAARGQGAYYNGNQVRVADHGELDQSMIAFGIYWPRGEMVESTLSAMRALLQRRIHGVRRFGSAALDLCRVGTGMLDAFFEFELSPWDFAAGRLFVEEAGGLVTTCRGDRLPLAATSVLATNGQIHAEMLDILRPHAPG